MRVRPLALADLDWIEHLEPVLFGLGAWSRQTYVDELRREDRSYLAAVDEDGTRLGYAGVALDPEWNIMTVGVAPSARRRGVATVLLDALIAQAREAGGDELFLEVRSADGGAQQLYRNAGFTPVGLRKKYYQPEGADAVVMKLALRKRGLPVGAEVIRAAESTPAESTSALSTSVVSTSAQVRENTMSEVFIGIDDAHDLIWSSTPPVVLDVRWALGVSDGVRRYMLGHLPGAVYVDLDRQLAGTASPEAGRHPLPDLADLQETARSWGMSSESQVLVYDDAAGTSAARAWWLLRWAGVAHVRIIDGGLRGWSEAGHHLEDGFVRPRPGDVELTAGALPTITGDEAAGFEGVLLDARAGERFRGEVEPVDPRAGHIPGATSAPTAANLTEGGWLLEEAELVERFAGLGVQPGSAVAVYCGSGVTASHTVAVLAALGIEAALYPGSFSQWSNDPGREVATGA